MTSRFSSHSIDCVSIRSSSDPNNSRYHGVCLTRLLSASSGGRAKNLSSRIDQRHDYFPELQKHEIAAAVKDASSF